MSEMRRKKIFDCLYDNGLVSDNDSKLLSYSCKRGKYFIWFRDRQKDQSYYLVTIKGNWIRGFRIRYEDKNSCGINTYTGLIIPALLTGEQPEELPVTKKSLLLKTAFRNYKNFVDDFRKVTPDLEWYD